jgi:hypothetical protein
LETSTVSLFQLHRCVYDAVRVREKAAHQDFDDGDYDLSDEERWAFRAGDLRALYRIGLHPLLLNAYGGWIGYGPDACRHALAPLATRDRRRARWHR